MAKNKLPSVEEMQEAIKKAKAQHKPAKSKDLRNQLKELLHKEVTNLPDLLEQMEAKDRAAFVLKLAPFVLPKVKPLNHSYDTDSSFGFDFRPIP